MNSFLLPEVLSASFSLWKNFHSFCVRVIAIKLGMYVCGVWKQSCEMRATTTGQVQACLVKVVVNLLQHEVSVVQITLLIITE